MRVCVCVCVCEREREGGVACGGGECWCVGRGSICKGQPALPCRTCSPPLRCPGSLSQLLLALLRQQACILARRGDAPPLGLAPTPPLAPLPQLRKEGRRDEVPVFRGYLPAHYAYTLAWCSVGSVHWVPRIDPCDWSGEQPASQPGAGGSQPDWGSRRRVGRPVRGAGGGGRERPAAAPVGSEGERRQGGSSCRAVASSHPPACVALISGPLPLTLVHYVFRTTVPQCCTCTPPAPSRPQTRRPS